MSKEYNKGKKLDLNMGWLCFIKLQRWVGIGVTSEKLHGGVTSSPSGPPQIILSQDQMGIDGL